MDADLMVWFGWELGAEQPRQQMEGGVADIMVLVASFSVVFIGGLVREAPARQMSRASASGREKLLRCF